MKLRPVTKLDKKNTGMSKKINDHVMSANRNPIVFIPIYGHFAAVGRPESVRLVYKIYIFINSNLLSYRTWKQN